jgi:hypothetical protein
MGPATTKTGLVGGGLRKPETFTFFMCSAMREASQAAPQDVGGLEHDSSYLISFASIPLRHTTPLHFQASSKASI